MNVLAPFPDAELVCLDLLAGLAATVTHTDEDLAPPVAQVQRVGGSDDGITDRPRVQITCFGATRAQAWGLAEQVRQLVLAAGGSKVTGDNAAGVLIDSTRTDTPAVQLPYANPDVRQVVATYRLDLRRPF